MKESSIKTSQGVSCEWRLERPEAEVQEASIPFQPFPLGNIYIYIYENILDDAVYEKLKTHLLFSMDLFLIFVVSANPYYAVLLPVCLVVFDCKIDICLKHYLQKY